jgi:hypothetical protein
MPLKGPQRPAESVDSFFTKGAVGGHSPRLETHQCLP